MARRAPGVTLLVLTAVLSWAAAGWLLLSAPGSAEAARVRSVSTVVLQPTPAGWQGVTFHMLLLDDGAIPFEKAAANARAAAVARIPGGVELEPGEVAAQFEVMDASWKAKTVSWSYNAKDAPPGLGEVFPLLATSAASWNLAGNADWRFQSPGTTGAPASICDGEGDGQNSVTWGTWPGDNVLAVTCLRGGGSLVEFDMIFVIDRAWSTGNDNVRVDLQSVATHEFGHALGLNHSADASSVMVTSYRQGRIRREPQADDIAGLIALYGSLPNAEPTATATPTSTPTATPTLPIEPPRPTIPAGSETPSPTASPALETPTPSPTASHSPAPAQPEPATRANGRILVPGLSRN